MPDHLNKGELIFVVSPRIQQACARCLEEMPKSHKFREEISIVARPLKQKSLKSDADATSKTISLSALKAVSDLMLSKVALTEGPSTGDHQWCIHQLVRGSQIYTKPLQTKPRNPELVARLDKIKKQIEMEEYKRMTENVPVKVYDDGVSKEDSSTAYVIPGVRAQSGSGQINLQSDIKYINRQMSIILNVLFSALGVGFAVSYASYTLTSQLGWRILLGMLSAIVIVTIEAWLFSMSHSRGKKKRVPRKHISKANKPIDNKKRQ